MKNPSGTAFYQAMRALGGLALGFYFRRIERFHPERVPIAGPLLFTSNHPNSLTDSFVIGAAVGRKVNFVATVQLFRWAPLKWLLTRCGVIPINRLRDDPKAMRSVADTFEACFGVLEAGETVGIFPEGITYDDAQLKEVKSGAARLALELEHRHEGKLGLKLVPVGLTYSAKERYRSDALVHFGQPLLAADFLQDYATRRKDCIRRLTEELERRLQGLIVHLPELEHARVVAGVRRLYLEQLLLGRRRLQPPASPRAEELVLTQRIGQAVEYIYRSEPERAAAFAAELARYEGWLARLRLSDEDLARFPEPDRLAWHSLGGALLAVVGAPIALYGWLHRLAPFALVRWAAHHFVQPGKRKAQASTAALISGSVAFGGFYAAYILLFHRFFGWPASLWYGLTLPLASLLAHYYLRHLRRLAGSLRNTLVLVRAPLAARRLLALRARLLAAIEAVHQEMRQAPQAQPANPPAAVSHPNDASRGL